MLKWVTHSPGLYSTKSNITMIISWPTLLIKHQFNCVLWSLLQTVVNYHIYCQKFLTQFPTKLSATTQPTQTLHKQCLCLIPLYETQVWHSDYRTIPHVVLSYDIMMWGAGKSLCAITSNFASHLLVTTNRNYNDSHLSRSREVGHNIMQTAVSVLSHYCK